MRFESDFVAYKPRTDLIVNATAYSPDGAPRQRWLCALRVSGSDGAVLLQKALQVHSERAWQRGLRGWSLSPASPCNAVPIRYELAYGGALHGPPGGDGNPGPWLAFCDRNPLGRGLLHRDCKAREVPAPRIEDPARPMSDPRQPSVPEGFGAIHRAWQPRLALAGTYDEAWLARKHPLPPDDFDPRHNNGAHPDLIGAGRAHGYLRGDETLRMRFPVRPAPRRIEVMLLKPRPRSESVHG